MERILIEGVVEHGRRLGRELGFPTANLAVPEDVAAADGVYRSRAEVGGKVYDAMSNLGRNPSVGGVERRLETHIFDFRGELYGRRLRVELLEKIRDERRFASVEELRGQIARDKENIFGLKYCVVFLVKNRGALRHAPPVGGVWGGVRLVNAAVRRGSQPGRYGRTMR